LRLKPTVFILFVTACLLIVGAFLWANRAIEDRKAAQLYKELHDQVALLSTVFDSRSTDVDRLVDEMSRHVPYRITVIAEDGTVVGDSDFSGEQLAKLENHANRTEIIDARRSGSGDRVRYSTSVEAWLMYSAARLRRSDGFVRIAVPVPNRVLLAPELRLPMISLLLAVAILAAIMNRRITKAVDQAKGKLEIAMDRIRDGKHLATSPGIPSGEELGSTARALEALAEDIEGQIHRLESERENLKAVLSSMSEGVLITDIAGRITRVNPAFLEISNLNRDPIGRTALEVVRSPLIEEGVSATLSNKSTTNHEAEIKIGDRVLLARFAPLEKDGAVLGVVIVFHEITRLRRLENVRKEFVSNLSHEFRTPLTSIQGFAETLLDEPCNSAAHVRFLPKIHRNAQQLSQMIEELFKLASLEALGERLEKQMVGFNSLVTELREEFGPRLSAKGIELVAESEPGTEFFPAHDAYMRRILHNLVDNAVKYTNSGFIKIAARRSGQDLIVSVSDSGVGIPPEDLSRVFERFYRVDKDRSRETGGSGIGLALVKHLVQIQGGRVWAESKLGEGSIFYFSLPAGAQSVAEATSK
jgi:two-component system phosphate regulon sensor histidine kinase PhoR